MFVKEVLFLPLKNTCVDSYRCRFTYTYANTYTLKREHQQTFDKLYSEAFFILRFSSPWISKFFH